MHRSPTSHRVLQFGLALLAFVSASAALSGTAMATTQATPCAKQVIADWYDDGRVGKIYPLECYRQAISSLPPDVLDYSNAKEEIGRALAFAKQGKPDPGGKDPTPPTTGTGTTGTGTTGTDTNGTDTNGTDTNGTDTNGTDTNGTDTNGTGTNGIDTTGADTGTTDTSGPSSVPIPLLVLGGLAVLLLAAGSAGYFRRRMQSDGDGDGTPPASA